MRQPDYQFFELDPEAETRRLIAKWEEIMGTPVTPASPQRLLIAYLTECFIGLKAEANHHINRNLASRAEGEDLDILGQDIYGGVERPGAEAAVCTVRFRISEPQAQVVVVPAGTRVTDKGGGLMWALPVNLVIPAGDSYADARVECQTPGVAGNGYAEGQINTLVDLYDYCAGVENITASEGGADEADDDTYYELMMAAADGMGSGGSRGSYVYNAKRASALIGDVVVNTKGPATIAIYALLRDGTAAGAELKAEIVKACNEDDRRPLTDMVTAVDPEFVDYNIALTYYIKKDAAQRIAQVQEAVAEAAKSYAAWQCKKLGRDINPEELVDRIRATGSIKRVVLTSPSYTVLRNGREKPAASTPQVYQAPQVARLGTVTLTNGGVEDE